MVIRNLHRLSRLFQPVSVVPKNAEVKRHDITSKSQRLMLELGIIRQASPGCFHFLPLGVKSLEKLTRLVDEEMKKIGGQKIIFPTLTNAKLWEKTGRLETVSSELFQIKDRHDQSYILSPTHEEAASNLLASLAPISYKHLPLKLYQITSKYRDEMKPRFGLMRGKQFLMKDMYSFDTDLETAKHTYDEICKSYDRIFRRIGIDFVKVVGCSGHMGGELSHEYHYKADVGEDKILTCNKCNYSANTEVSGEEKCPNCGNTSVKIHLGIEVGHTFLLGEKYSKPLNATFLNNHGKPDVLQMGSYGLGLSRILAAVIEVMSSEQEIRWPQILSPYSVIILPPKSGSKEETHIKDSGLVDSLYEKIETTCNLQDNVLIDDRTNFTIGRRFLEAKKNGYPFIVTLGKKIVENPLLYEITNLKTNETLFLSENDLMNYLRSQLSSFSSDSDNK
ncbi:probable proline--tRNA ligase, mitochondrial [Tribolium castaneum]|uniref:Probable proline--tRNA ligase, mitochondrial n=1 Tax=Tribolium castaneum TaxID=7070 RepID=D6WC57_TRICA|nr:PREDICTED: probable proline--tRNA ligase, mitochondrial [Tribolium castaneum]EEZ98764.2 putative proline--tRNA ligase, mitochondrial-like Protein [Tribolium castaneum]|eukprot:XP_971952.1 PREDICTED: probable proline--tRNA ligase, mitochondrial [Tribolium castaneum]